MCVPAAPPLILIPAIAPRAQQKLFEVLGLVFLTTGFSLARHDIYNLLWSKLLMKALSLCLSLTYLQLYQINKLCFENYMNIPLGSFSPHQNQFFILNTILSLNFNSSCFVICFKSSSFTLTVKDSYGLAWPFALGNLHKHSSKEFE